MLLTPTDAYVWRGIALGLALFGITAGSTARAAEIKLLCAVALHPAVDVLIPDFEKSSGHKGRIRKRGRYPDISSADAFKRTMLAARSIAYPDPAGGGASSIYLASLLERLGVAATPDSRLDRTGSRLPKRARSGLMRRHSITSSARLSMAAKSTPRARAVFRLMTNSKVVGSSIGSSKGFLPRRILSA